MHTVFYTDVCRYTDLLNRQQWWSSEAIQSLFQCLKCLWLLNAWYVVFVYSSYCIRAHFMWSHIIQPFMLTHVFSMAGCLGYLERNCLQIGRWFGSFFYSVQFFYKVHLAYRSNMKCMIVILKLWLCEAAELYNSSFFVQVKPSFYSTLKKKLNILLYFLFKHGHLSIFPVMCCIRYIVCWRVNALDCALVIKDTQWWFSVSRLFWILSEQSW